MLRYALALCMVISLFVATFLPFSSTAHATFLGIGDLAGGIVTSEALGVSADGMTVVGSSRSGPGKEAIRWTMGTGLMSLVMPPNTSSSQANAVSADGSVIVGRFKPDQAGLPTEAFRWEAGVTTPLVPLAPTSEANGVSASGSVVVGHSGLEAFRWVGGTMTGLGNLPGGVGGVVARGVSADGSIVTGDGSSAAISSEAFIWTQTDGMFGLGDLPGSDPTSRVWAISADGTTVVGQSHSTLGPGGEAFMWTQTDEMVALGVLGNLPGSDPSSFALAVSADGTTIVGRSSNSGTSGSEAFIWDELNGMRSLKSLLIAQGHDLTGWTLTEAIGISEDGLTIVGNAENPSGNQEGFWAQLDGDPLAQPIPEPSTFLLTGIGLVGLIGYNWRRWKKA